MTEDYVNFVGDLMYPKKKFGTFGYNLAKSKVVSFNLTKCYTILGYIHNVKWNILIFF